MDSKDHWENVYTTKSSNQVSWFQEHAQQSLQFIKKVAPFKDAKIIDVGGGASTLIEELIRSDYQDITVLDISNKAIETAKSQLGDKASQVNWINANITTEKFPSHYFDVWHDRAVFHFLTDENDRTKYVESVCHSLKPRGHVVMATFSLDGPLKCSGLEVTRYSPQSLHNVFGNRLSLINHVEEKHKTPFGTEQQFIYCLFRKN